MMLENNRLDQKQAKYIKALKLKKYREQEHKFVVEGEKNVISILKSNWNIHHLLCTLPFQTRYQYLLESAHFPLSTVDKKMLRSLGNYKSNETALAVIEKPKENYKTIDINQHAIILDDVRDPGNLGTILRIADWYGIKQVIMSPECTEVWNPKVITSSMGSIINLSTQYADLLPFLADSPHQKWATTMKGQNIYDVKFDTKKPIMFIFGNESNGISKPILDIVSNHITIPGANNIDSLNVGVSVGIVCDHLFRQLRH